MGSRSFHILRVPAPLLLFSGFNLLLALLYGGAGAQDADTVICGGFVKSDFPLDYSQIEVQLLDKSGNLKYQATCATNNGNYEVPIFGKKGDFILAISARQGLVFEPSRINVHIDGQTDPCSKQENLDFRFAGFSVGGKVQSLGSNSGPPGVTVKVLDSSSKLVATVVTGLDGQFRIPSLLPGVYNLEASHPRFQLQKPKATITVTEKTLTVPDQSLVVGGYPVSGNVKSSGEPIGGVQFLLFSKTGKDTDVTGCDKVPATEETKEKEKQHGRFLCSTKSDTKGDFVFGSLAPSTYILVPVYSGGNTKYDIEPSTFQFTLGHDALMVAKSFEIKGFTATGTVLTSPKGSGIPSADVFINGTLTTKTDRQGRYQLDRTIPGWYSVDVKKDHYDFPTLYTKITPGQSAIPPVVARSINVCGQIKTLRPVSRILSFDAVDTKTGISRDTVVRDNTFCVLLESGAEYKVSIFDAPQDKTQQLVFSPAEKIIKLTDFPITDLLFTQVLGSVSGAVKCIGSRCPADLRVSLLAESGELFADLDADGVFKFTGVSLGTHAVKIVEPKSRHCWDLVQKVVEVTVTKPTVTVGFAQTGFLFEVWTSHDTDISYRLVGSETQQNILIKRGFAEICLAKPGRYQVQPKSCHKFEQDTYIYNTDAPERLSIHAVGHLASISIVTDDEKLSFKLRIKKNSDGSSSILAPSDKPQILGPDLYQYSFIEHFASEEELTIVPSSDSLLFKPSQAELTVTDNCEKNIVKLEAFKGVFITGATKPAVPDADVVLTTETEVFRGKTDESGRFSLGPIPRASLRDVVVEKRGYLFEKINGTLTFAAAKLSEIRVHTLDDQQNPIPGVLVSISSAAGVRTSNFTDSSGSLSFVSFAPGDYIVRPMVKEYKFEPSSKSVTVSQGQTAQVQWVGTRIAYSVFGKVGALGGEPEAGVVFEAVSLDPCPQMQEESVSGANGHFRISGLKAGCAYEVRAKEGELTRLDLKWTSPPNRTVHMGKEDISGLSFVAFRGFNDAEFTGRVAATREVLSQLKVCLFRADRPDESVQCVSFPTSNPMFYFNPVPLDGRAYILRIESSLSKKEFVFSTEELHVKANSTFRHFVMPFTTSRRQLEPEIDVSTMWLVPLAIMAAIVYFKRETALPALRELVGKVMSGKSFAGSLKDKRKAAAASAAAAQQVDDLDDNSTLKKRTKAAK